MSNVIKKLKIPKKYDDNTAVLSTRISKELHLSIKAMAASRKVTLSHFVSDMLDENLKLIEKESFKKRIMFDAVSFIGKIPYVIIGCLAGLGLAIIVKDVVIPFAEPVVNHLIDKTAVLF